MNKFLYAIPLCLFTCCSRSEDGLTELNNEIDLSYAITNAKKDIFTSQFIDSITFIPLETKSNNLLNKTTNVELTTEYKPNLCNVLGDTWKEHWL